MSDFIIKSTLCLVVLLIAYHLFLEREKMHVFNRFYLLFSIVFSLTIPFLSFEIVKEIPTKSLNIDNLQIISLQNNVEQTNYLPLLLWLIYGLITLLLTVKFIKNVINLVNKAKSATTIELQNAKLILLKEKTLPHTFLNTIFINEEDYSNRKIEAELFEHELTHVKQKHTLDVLFIEILKTIFWFNPIFAFYKKAIQLNHEFLADEKVVESYKNVSFYQELLLSKAKHNQNFYLTSNLNYLVTKKRLIMMTKTTSRSNAYCCKIALLPIFTALLFLFSIKSIAQEKETKPQNKEQTENKQENIYSSVDKKPEFPGGFEEFYKYVGASFTIPENFKGNGKIITQFVVEKDGSLSDIKILRDLGGMGDEVIRVLKASPKWIPGEMNKTPVRVMFPYRLLLVASK